MKIENKIYLETPIQNIYWLNTVQKKKIQNFFGDKVIDYLLNHPIDVIDKNIITTLSSEEINKLVSIDVEINNILSSYNKRQPTIIECYTKLNQKLNVIYFNISSKYIHGQFKKGSKYRITGKLGYFHPYFQIIHPVSWFKDEVIDESFEKIEPSYNLKKSTINKSSYRKLVINTFKEIKHPKIVEWITRLNLRKYKWDSFYESLKCIHFPKSSDLKKIENYRQRLAFDEVLANILMIKLLKNNEKKCILQVHNNTFSSKIIQRLNFDLTKDQKDCFENVKNDIRTKRMFRLIQGDVGSGKTIIALLTVADVINSGHQAVIMAPSEILIQQHYKYFKNIFGKFKINICTISGKLTSKKKREIYENLFHKKIDILIGTHALLNEKINFADLGLIVIDEQHKFGVNQRLRLQKKSSNSHILILSATPIPRSLTFIIYGEIDVSLIKNKPQNRRPIKTTIIGRGKIDKVIKGIERIIDKKQKVFWVLPKIGEENREENITKEESSVIQRYNFLKNKFQSRVSFIHGRMKKDDIEETFNKFKEDEVMILVTTTLVEVGIDIPKATTIIIEEANYFGLAQLHQLRGRVGRNDIEANCVLIYTKNISNTGKERLMVMKSSNDGFYISEKDLKIRGGGEIFGIRQTGLPTWRFFQPHKDLSFIDDIKDNIDYVWKNRELTKKIVGYFFNNEKIDNYFTG